MRLASGRASGHKTPASKKLSIMYSAIKHGQGAALSTPLASPSAIVKPKEGESGMSGGGYSLDDGLNRSDKTHECRLRVGSVNVTSMWKREGEVVEMVARRRLDFCCIQESRWKGEGAKVLGSKSMKCKFFWKGCDSGYAGVGVIVSERWISQVIEVRRVSERIIVLRVAIGKMVINVISAYAPQVNLSMEEKEDFWVRMIETVSSIGPGERVLIGGDLNGHVGAESSGYEDVHGGFGFGDRNVEGEMILESAEAMGMIIANTWFKKNGTEKKVTFERDNCKTAIDFIMVRKSERSMITDVNVIKTEAFIPQHKLLICKVRLFEKTVRSRQAFVSRTKVWRLKEEAVQNKFKEVVERMEVSKNTVDSGGSVEVLWSGFRDCMTEAAEHVCGRTKGRQVHHETWWWNDEVDRAVSEKRDWYRIWSKSKTEANKMVYKSDEEICREGCVLCQGVLWKGVWHEAGK